MVSSTPPPASNTGVENKIVSQTVDWIEGTFKQETRRILPDELSKEYQQCRPLNGYTEGYKFSDGRLELKNHNRPDMGTHVIWSGDAIRAIPMPASNLVEFLYSSAFTFTRIDFAIDAYNFELRPEDATIHIENRAVVTRAKKFPIRGDARLPGYTQYIGTKASEIFVRIYDKAAEMGVQQDYARVELVVRGGRATQAAQTIIRNGDFRPLVLGFVRFQEWKEWEEVMASDAVSLPSEKKPSNTEQWLLEQCAPALARLIVERGSHDIWFKFKDEVAAQVNIQESRKRHTVN